MALPHGSNIKEIIELLKKHNLAEIEIKGDNQTIRVAAHTHSPASQPLSTPQPTSATQATAATSETTDQLCVRAPLVGTVYLSPSPDEPPFVQTNQKIKKGQTVCLIEVMKTFNHITCTEDAVVTDICVKNGQTVEFNQILLQLAKG